MDPESCLSCIIIELRVLERHINSFFHLGQPNKIRYLTKSDTFCEIQNSTRDTTILEHLL
jgi:hypothetical protein